MSTNGKLRAREERKKRKRERRAANVDMWAAQIRAGTNAKSRTYRAVRAHRSRHNHAAGPCGNVGCRRCNPIAANLLTPGQLRRRPARGDAET